MRASGAIYLAFILISSLVFGCSSGSEKLNPEALFFNGNRLYEEGRYDDAIGEYEKILASGQGSGPVFFNLANAYFKSGEKGYAILNYERARMWIPADPDLEANLNYARSLTQAEECKPALWDRVLFAFSDAATTSRLLKLSLGLYTLTIVLLALYYLLIGRPTWLRYAMITSALLTLVVGASWLRRAIVIDQAVRAVIVNEGTTQVRFEPAENGTIHYALEEGTLLQLIEERQGWSQVSRCDGKRGWTESKSLARLAWSMPDS